MAYCSNCGQELVEGAKFCYNCGTATQLESSERKATYEGEIHKCPNCGDIIDAYETVCESCGFEIRGRKAASSVQTLVEKLSSIDERQMPEHQEKASIMKVIVGKDFNGDKAEEERQRFHWRKEEEKANLIVNYPIPNTKEDIMEFFFLASSNIGKGSDIDSAVTKAWIGKMDQIIEKAAVTIKNEQELARIKEMYFQKTGLVRKKKIITYGLPFFILGGIILFCLFMMLISS